MKNYNQEIREKQMQLSLQNLEMKRSVCGTAQDVAKAVKNSYYSDMYNLIKAFYPENYLSLLLPPDPMAMYSDGPMACEGPTTVCSDTVANFRVSQLSDTEQRLRQARLKSHSGNWTDAAIRIFIEDMMNQKEATARMVEIAKDLIEKKKC